MLNAEFYRMPEELLKDWIDVVYEGGSCDDAGCGVFKWSSKFQYKLQYLMILILDRRTADKGDSMF